MVTSSPRGKPGINVESLSSIPEKTGKYYNEVLTILKNRL